MMFILLKLQTFLFLLSTEIDGIQQAKKDAKAKKRREKTAVVGDMQVLGDTLPTLDLLLRDLDTPQATVRYELWVHSCEDSLS